MNAVLGFIGVVVGIGLLAGRSLSGSSAAEQRAGLIRWARSLGSSLHQEHVDAIAAAIVAAARQYGAPVEILAAIAYHESRWNPLAENGTACGAWQQKAEYSARWSDRGWRGDPDARPLTCAQLCTDVEQAARICARKIATYRRDLGSMRLALCAYARGTTGGRDCAQGGPYADEEIALAAQIAAIMGAR